MTGCGEKALSPLYCEGGVDYKGGGMGGACLSVPPGTSGTDPRSGATSHWQTDHVAERYGVRRIAKNRYELLLNGTPVGTLDRDDNWIKVKFTSDPTKTYSLRDDPPGFLN